MFTVLSGGLENRLRKKPMGNNKVNKQKTGAIHKEARFCDLFMELLFTMFILNCRVESQLVLTHTLRFNNMLR